MNKKVAISIIVLSTLLIVFNIIFTSDKIDLGFYLRISSSALLILAMYLVLNSRKNVEKK